MGGGEQSTSRASRMRVAGSAGRAVDDAVDENHTRSLVVIVLGSSPKYRRVNSNTVCHLTLPLLGWPRILSKKATTPVRTTRIVVSACKGLEKVCGTEG